MPFFSKMRANIRFSPVISCRSNKGVTCSTSTSFQAMCMSIEKYCRPVQVTGHRSQGTGKEFPKPSPSGHIHAHGFPRGCSFHQPPPPPPPPPPPEEPPPPEKPPPPDDDPGGDDEAETALENPLLKDEANAAGDEAIKAPLYHEGE